MQTPIASCSHNHEREREIGFFRDEREVAWERWVVTVTGGMDKEGGVGNVFLDGNGRQVGRPSFSV
jgi:hypothetical protein